jgi:hypothetical protein
MSWGSNHANMIREEDTRRRRDGGVQLWGAGVDGELRVK